LFTSSNIVKNHLISNGVDPDTVHLPDKKFMTKVFYILPTYFGYRPKITID